MACQVHPPPLTKSRHAQLVTRMHVHRPTLAAAASTAPLSHTTIHTHTHTHTQHTKHKQAHHTHPKESCCSPVSDPSAGASAAAPSAPRSLRLQSVQHITHTTPSCPITAYAQPATPPRHKHEYIYKQHTHAHVIEHIIERCTHTYKV